MPPHNLVPENDQRVEEPSAGDRLVRTPSDNIEATGHDGGIVPSLTDNPIEGKHRSLQRREQGLRIGCGLTLLDSPARNLQ